MPAEISGGPIWSGHVVGTGLRMAVAASRFNDLIVDRLVSGALDAFVRHGVAATDISVAWAPGALELPLVAKRLALSGHFDAVVVLGAVIRGETGHYDVVVGQCAAGVSSVSLETGVPVIFGVLTTDNVDQAIDRAGTKAGNKGADAAQAAIEMADLLRQLPGPLA